MMEGMAIWQAYSKNVIKNEPNSKSLINKMACTQERRDVDLSVSIMSQDIDKCTKQIK